MNMILSRPLSGLMTMRAGSRRIFATALGAHSRDMSPCADTALLEGMHRWVDRCNTGSEDDFIPLDVAGSQVGFVARDSAMKLAEWRDCQVCSPVLLLHAAGAISPETMHYWYTKW